MKQRRVADIEQADNYRDERKREVDLSKIPESVLAGLTKGNGSASVLRAEDLEDEGNEVWILQCTKNVKVGELLEGKKVILEQDRPTRLLAGHDNPDYESIAVPLDSEQRGNIATLLPDQAGKIKLVSCPLSGYILLRESIPEVPPPFFDTNPPNFHQLPSGLKHRHPVYGVDFSELLVGKLDRDNETPDADSSYKSSKKHKDKKSKSPSELGEIVSEGFNETLLVPVPKKRKHKLDCDNEIPDADSSYQNSKKHKDKKSKFASELGEIVFEGFNDTLLIPVPKKRKHKLDCDIEIQDTDSSYQSSKKHKDKKSKSTSGLGEIVSEGFDDTLLTPGPKKRKHKLDCDNEICDTDSSYQSSKKHKDKKSKSASELGEIVSEDFNDALPIPVPKKRKHELDCDNEIQDTDSSYQSSKKHKKKKSKSK